jgi:radical SAM superfamily enzyme YgiQ (UPF0313 family)
MPRLTVIQPSHYRSKADRSVYKCKRRSVVPLTLPYLAALTPPEWEISLVDEQLDDIDFGARVDMVALSAWTLHSWRAYDIAAEFRRRGVTVVMGGPHAFFHPEEAEQHCDAVVVGEAEPVWAQVLADAAAGRLRKIYRAAPLTELGGLPKPRYDLLDLRRYGPFRTYALQSSRGCPFRCDFCSERLYLGAGFRWRPAADVADDIRHAGAKRVFFGESNFGGHHGRAMELMEALIPLKVRWSTLWSSHLCLDREFLDLAKRSGVLHVNIGLESIDGESLAAMNKKMNKVDRYAEMFHNLRSRGISYSLNFIFGCDGENPAVFPATLEFLHRHKVPAAYFNVLTPTKGTGLYQRMEAEGRIIAAEEIDRYPGQVCHIKPPYGTPEEMEERIQKMYRDFYTLPSMLARLPVPVTQADIASWAINLSERRMAYSAQGNNDFDGY